MIMIPSTSAGYQNISWQRAQVEWRHFDRNHIDSWTFFGRWTNPKNKQVEKMWAKYFRFHLLFSILREYLGMNWQPHITIRKTNKHTRAMMLVRSEVMRRMFLFRLRLPGSPSPSSLSQCFLRPTKSFIFDLFVVVPMIFLSIFLRC